MGNWNSNTTHSPRNSRASQNVNVSQSSPYLGSSSQPQSTSTGWRSSYGYSTNPQSTEDNPRRFSSPHNANTISSVASSGARPKQSTGDSSSDATVLRSLSSSACVRFPPSLLQHRRNHSTLQGLVQSCARESIKGSTGPMLAEKAPLIMRGASKAYNEKDEEKAFVLYERYTSVWAHITESREYKITPKEFDNILTRTDVQTAYNRIDELERSLKSRYPNQPVPARSSQVLSAAQAQTPASLPKDTNSAVDQPKRESFRPSQLHHPSADLHGGIVEDFRENLICPVCYELPENVKSLPCGHFTCEKCIGQLVNTKGGVLSCPTCRATHSVPSNGVAGLPTNFALKSMVTKLKEVEERRNGEVEELPSSSASPTVEDSFLQKVKKKCYKDAKGLTIRMRVQLCDSEGNQLRGRECDKVEVTVFSPSNEKVPVSVTLMKRDGDYSLTFIPKKIGVYLVNAYLNNVPIRGSPSEVIVHPSAKFKKFIHHSLESPKDAVVYGQKIYTTDDSEEAYRSTDWEGNWDCPCEDNFDVVSFGIATAGSRFYVTVPNKSAVYVYDQFGIYVYHFGKKVLESPTGIAISRTGTIYVADSQTNTIELFRDNFSHIHSIQAGGNANHCSLALLALNPTEDRLIAADQKQDCFKIFDVFNMKRLKMINTRVQQAPARPFGVAVDEDGNILLTAILDSSKLNKREDHNRQNNKRRTGAVITYNSHGYFIGKFGDNELQNPRGLCIVDGEVVVIDAACLKVYEL